MKILTVENTTYELNSVPDAIDDVRYCVLDCSDAKNIDYYFYPLIFLESFYSPSVVLEIGQYRVEVPLDWSMVVCDEELTEIEVVPISSLNDRGFFALPYSPFRSTVPDPVEVSIVNVYADVKWYFPKLRDSSLLPIPLSTGTAPKCVLFVKDGSKLPTVLELADLFG